LTGIKSKYGGRPLEKDIASPDEINELLKRAGLNRRACSKLLNMPYRTLENYCAGYRPCARWIYKLLKYRLLDEIDEED
jgi:hypothetical protein